ncbi:MAG: PKD domain-containing protein [Nanoarchaeota archaeon]|nr:PKD domain-containing protein [Nanoarchaeota archaeon]
MKVKFFLIFGIIFLIGITSASFSIDNNFSSIALEYPKDSTIFGSLNLSFDNQAGDSIISDSFENKIELLDLLKTDSNYKYTCNPLDCGLTYKESNSEYEKKITLKKGESKIIGIVLEGIITEIDSVNFNISTNAGESCEDQLQIDFLSDESIEIKNKNISINTCSEKSYSCFKESGSTEIIISQTPFCQKFSLQNSPGLKAGAWIKQINSGTENLNLSLYSEYGDKLASCELDKTQITSSGNEVFCNLEHSTNIDQEYYICLSADDSFSSYRTKGHSGTCGFSGYPIKTPTTAYFISAQTLKFAKPSLIEIKNIQEEFEFSILMENYLQEKYDNNCTDSCLIPIKINSNINQDINIKDIKIIYSKKGLPGIEENNFYDFKITAPKINSEYQLLSISNAGFKTPSTIGEKNYEIDFDGINIFKEKIKILDLIFDISPKNFAVFFPAKININSDIFGKIYIWDFGDNEILNTTKNTTIHSYSSEGEFIIEVKIINQLNQIFSKQFKVNVFDSNKLVEKRLYDFQQNIKNIELIFSGLDIFTKEMIKNSINFENTKLEIKKIETDFAKNLTGIAYEELVKSVLEINLPKNLFISSTDEIFFYPDEDIIDMKVLAQIQNKSTNLTSSSILSWYENSISTKISTKDVSFLKESGENIYGFRIYSLNFKNIKDSEEVYFIIENLQKLQFENPGLVNSINNYKYYKIKNNEKIKFSSTGKIDVANLPIFFSPDLSKLNTNEFYEEHEEKNKTLFVILIILFIIVVVLIVYYFMSMWYRKNYESHLFPNRNNLFNILNYINTSKNKKMSQTEIRKNLKKVGWKPEQISYAFKKYSGKNTGLPVFLGKKRIKTLINKRKQ